MNIGFIGVGIMGTGMVSNLCKDGFSVKFVARDDERSRANARIAREKGAVEVENYEMLAIDSDVIMLSLPDSNIVEHVLLSDQGIGPHLRKGQVVVDFSTSYPPSTRKLSETLKSRDIDLIDAPLTGSKPQADTGTLNVIVGGPEKIFEIIKPAFNAIASNVIYVGSVGMGHTIKLINNYLGQTNLAAICEILVFAQTYGVDLQKLHEVVSVSGGNSTSFQGCMPRFMARDFAINFQQRLVLKDIRYMTDFTREAGVPTPLADTLLAIHEQAFANGYGEEDTTAMLKFFEENARGSSPPKSK